MSSALPISHPPIDGSSSSAGCPVRGLSESHGFIAAREGDSRSPCPALNVMANHGYIHRDGQNITATDVCRGLQKCYGLNALFSAFLSYGGYLALFKLGRGISLKEIGKHNAIEHDASLVHRNTPKGEKYAPIRVDPDLVDALFKDIRPTSEEVDAQKAKGEEAALLFGLEDIARARVRREKEAGPLGSLRARIARGEMALSFGVFATSVGEKMGIPADFLRTWIQDERLPDGWKPTRKMGYYDMYMRGDEIKRFIEKIRAEESAGTNSND